MSLFLSVVFRAACSDCARFEALTPMPMTDDDDFLDDLASLLAGWATHSSLLTFLNRTPHQRAHFVVSTNLNVLLFIYAFFLSGLHLVLETTPLRQLESDLEPRTWTLNEAPWPFLLQLIPALYAIYSRDAIIHEYSVIIVHLALIDERRSFAGGSVPAYSQPRHCSISSLVLVVLELLYILFLARSNVIVVLNIIHGPSPFALVFLPQHFFLARCLVHYTNSSTSTPFPPDVPLTDA